MAACPEGAHRLPLYQILGSVVAVTMPKTMAVNKVCDLMNTKLMLDDALALGNARNKELLNICHGNKMPYD